MADNTSCVILFAKYPEPGAVKSRIARIIGEELAARVQAAFIRDTLVELERTGLPVVIVYRPINKRDEMVEFCGSHRDYIPQDVGDIGFRMYSAFQQVFQRGYERAVLIGSDIPVITAEIINEAVSRLHVCDAVIGPAKDGGYYLFGTNSSGLLREYFSRIPWSTDMVLQRTIEVFERRGIASWLGPALTDIDTISDYIESMKILKAQGRTDTETYKSGTILGLDNPDTNANP